MRPAFIGPTLDGTEMLAMWGALAAALSSHLGLVSFCSRSSDDQCRPTSPFAPRPSIRIAWVWDIAE